MKIGRGQLTYPGRKHTINAMVILSVHLAKEKKQNKVQKVIDMNLVYDNRAFSE